MARPLLLLLAALAAGRAPRPQDDTARIRGLTISTHGNGDDWASDRIAHACQDAQDLGANWIAVHPYAGITQLGEVRPWQGRDNPEPIARPIREAHARGLKVLIVPHLAEWGSGFGWRGDIGFGAADDSNVRWTRFFAGYGDWLAGIAEVAHDADALVVGSELDQTITHAAQWREVIGRVRTRTRAPLTYAANWTDYQRVPFWDALDAVGIDAYFPLVDDSVVTPTRQDLERGWKRHMADIAAFARRHDKHVVFTELGYNRSLRAAHTPWAYQTHGAEAEPLQTMCLEVALRAVEAEPRVVGCFLWKWFPPPRRVSRNFQLATPANIEVIKRVWPAGR